MKAIALTAAGLLASTPVGAQTLKLPNEMLGTWCTTQDPFVEEKDGTIPIKYERRQDCNPKADDTSIVLGPRGYEGQDVSWRRSVASRDLHCSCKCAIAAQAKGTIP
jgi:hypothetical protein